MSLPGHLAGADIRVVRVEGRLDGASAAAFEDRLVAQLAQHPCALVLDLSRARALGGEGVRSLVRIAASAGEADIGLVLAGRNRVIGDALAAAEVIELFEMHTDVDVALATFAGDAPQPGWRNVSDGAIP
jgi:anti-anti-sigma factor